MKTGIAKNWRDAATLIVLSRSNREASRCRDPCNYDVLLQTRTQKATFKNSVVFPGGVVEAADSSPEWLRLLSTFGYSQGDFDALHRVGSPVTPLFQDNPVQRHVTLRITAIRETFEELGVLICSSSHKKDRDGLWANVLSEVDVKQWQSRIAKNPGELLNLCKELNCYPDIWSLSYWSNWFSPSWIPKRFDTAFFITAIDTKPATVKGITEVAKVEWLSPFEILKRSKDSNVVLFPPQSYELNTLTQWSDIEQLLSFATENSAIGRDLFYHATVLATDGKLLVLPGDSLYPASVDFHKNTVIKTDKTVLELRENSESAHRVEFTSTKAHIVLKNYNAINMNMGDKVIPIQTTLS